MKVYAFVGTSGTGKSHRAQWVAKQNNIECIIDDGLLIKGNKVLWGSSAKREETKVASVKRAIFNDENIAKEMQKHIKENKVESILVLGTSENMVEKIVKALGLPKIERIIHIEDVATEKEIKQAVETRKNEGKHVIPVPTFELKKDFSGYMLDPLKIFRKRGTIEAFSVDTSIIRPTFSYLGRYKISDYAIYNIVEKVIKDCEQISRCTKFSIDTEETGLIINIDMIINYMGDINKNIKNFQEKVKKELEYLTGINILSINIVIKNIYID